MADNTTSKKITLISSDGEKLEVSETVMKQFQAIFPIIEHIGTENVILIYNVTGRVLQKVIDYCQKHADIADDALQNDEMSDEELSNWDKQFIDVDQAMLYDLIMAANYLDIEGLLHLTCQKVADMMKGKSPVEIRQIFNITNDLTAEEEEKICRENQWAFN